MSLKCVVSGKELSDYIGWYLIDQGKHGFGCHTWEKIEKVIPKDTGVSVQAGFRWYYLGYDERVTIGRMN